MKSARVKSLFAAFGALVCAAVLAAAPAFANSGPPWEEGITASGAHVLNEQSVLQVEKENLTFNIKNFPRGLQEGEKYDSTVTAEYTFYNPTENTVHTKMAFPYGIKPYYADELESVAIPNPVTVDGNPIEYQIRHTYGYYYNFDECVAQLKDDYATSDFFTPDLPVTEYRFVADAPDDDYVTYRATPFVDYERTRFGSTGGMRLNRNAEPRSGYSAVAEPAPAPGSYTMSFYGYGDCEVIFYVLGDDVDLSNLNWTATRYNNFWDKDVSVNATVTLDPEIKRGTFSEYVFKDYNEENGISRIDWYNGALHGIGGGINVGNCFRITPEMFNACCTYETYIPAGGRITNTVTVPLYPRIFHDYEPDLYGFTYYLSPAQKWASFKDLTVTINTDYYLQANEYDTLKFEKTENGYVAKSDTLPEGELDFRLSTSENPKAKVTSYTVFGIGIIVLLIVGACVIVLGGIAAVVFAIVYLTKSGKKKHGNTDNQQTVNQQTNNQQPDNQQTDNQTDNQPKE